MAFLELLAAGEDDLEGLEILLRGAAEVELEEGGGAPDEGGAAGADDVDDGGGVEGVGVAGDAHVGEERVPDAAHEAEGVEEGQDGAHVVLLRGGEEHAQGLDLGEDGVVAEHDALGLAGGAGGEEDHGDVVGAGGVALHHPAQGEELRGEGGGELGAGGGRLHEVLEEDIGAVGDGEVGEALDELAAGEDGRQLALADGGGEGGLADGEVEVDGALAEEGGGDVAEHRGAAGGEEDADVAGVLHARGDGAGDDEGADEGAAPGEADAVGVVGEGVAPVAAAGADGGFAEGGVLVLARVEPVAGELHDGAAHAEGVGVGGEGLAEDDCDAVAVEAEAAEVVEELSGVVGVHRAPGAAEVDGDEGVVRAAHDALVAALEGADGAGARDAALWEDADHEAFVEGGAGFAEGAGDLGGGGLRADGDDAVEAEDGF